MAHHKTQQHRGGQRLTRRAATTASLAFLLRDPDSTDEWRRTIAAWSQFIEAHLHDEQAQVRFFAQLCLARRAAAYVHLKEDEAALSDVEQVLSEAQASPNPSVVCKALEIKATIQVEQHDEAAALTTFAELWPLLPSLDLESSEQAELWLERGKCYGRLKRYEAAIADFTQAITLDPTCGEAWCWRGLSHRYQDNPEQALTDATQAITCDPANATFYRIRGILHRMSNHFTESLGDLDKAKALAPDDPWVEQNWRETELKWLLCRGPDALSKMEQTIAQRERENRETTPVSTQSRTAAPPAEKPPLAPPLPVVSPEAGTHQAVSQSHRSARRAARSARVPQPEQGVFF